MPRPSRDHTRTSPRSHAVKNRAASGPAANAALVEKASVQVPGKVKHVRTYTLTPGVAHLYNEGDLHSPKRDASTKLIRIEGTDMTKVQRLKFVPV